VAKFIANAAALAKLHGPRFALSPEVIDTIAKHAP